MDQYVVQREIGKGAYGTAYIVQHKTDGQRYVMKKVRLARQCFKERQASMLELQLLASLEHRNVLGLHEAWVEAGCAVCSVVELCESGDLATQLRLRVQDQAFFAEEHLHEMLVQLASALKYIHANAIAHRDIKSSNIFITAAGCLKLADFGLATVLTGDAPVSRTLVGTPGYMAPQLMVEGKVAYDGPKNDMWGLGCVMYEMSALKPAFSAFNMEGLAKKVTRTPPPALPAHYSEQWRGIIKALLTKDEGARPSAEEVLALPWLQPARARVAARFGPELPQGAEEIILLKELPGEIGALAASFKQQEVEAERKKAEEKERKKLLAAKYAPKGLVAKQAAAELAAAQAARAAAAGQAAEPGAAAAAGAGAAKPAGARAAGLPPVGTRAALRAAPPPARGTAAAAGQTTARGTTSAPRAGRSTDPSAPTIMPGTRGTANRTASMPAHAAGTARPLSSMPSSNSRAAQAGQTGFYLDTREAGGTQERPSSAPPSPSRTKGALDEDSGSDEGSGCSGSPSGPPQLLRISHEGLRAESSGADVASSLSAAAAAQLGLGDAHGRKAATGKVGLAPAGGSPGAAGTGAGGAQKGGTAGSPARGISSLQHVRSSVEAGRPPLAPPQQAPVAGTPPSERHKKLARGQVGSATAPAARGLPVLRSTSTAGSSRDGSSAHSSPESGAGAREKQVIGSSSNRGSPGQGLEKLSEAMRRPVNPAC